MKVTIRGIDPKLWEETRIDAIKENKTMGQLVNEGLELRREAKRKELENKAKS